MTTGRRNLAAPLSRIRGRKKPMTNALRELDSLLNRKFVGHLAHLQNVLTLGREDPHALSLSEVLNEDSIAAIVESFCVTHGNTPRIAVLSIWSKWYFTTIVPPLISANVCVDVLPPCRASVIKLVLNESYMIERGIISDGLPTVVAPGTASRLAPLVEELIAPFIERFHRCTGVPHSVLWSNAGNLVEGVVRHLEKIDAPDDAVRECDAYLNLPRLADGRRNRLYRPVVYTERSGERARRRRVCCLRYTLPDGKLCCACPRHENASTRSVLLQEPEDLLK